MKYLPKYKKAPRRIREDLEYFFPKDARFVRPLRQGEYIEKRGTCTHLICAEDGEHTTLVAGIERAFLHAQEIDITLYFAH